jgi:hypothetical protein
LKKVCYILPLFFIYQSYAQIADFDSINLKKADSIALSYIDEDLTNLPDLSYKLTRYLDTDIERFRSIYRWVCATIKNDYALYLKNKYKRNRFKDDSIKLKTWNTEFRKKLFKKLLNKKRTICTGYAYLVKELAAFANLDCEIVQGYGRVSTTNVENLSLPNHSWNAIKLNNKWYLCDATWASGIPNPETNKFTFQYNDGFFLTNPQLFAVNHFPVDTKWRLLKEDTLNFKTFLEAPIIYGKAYKNLEAHETPQRLHHNLKPTEKLVFKYKLKPSVAIENEKFYFLIDNGSSLTKIKPTSILINKALLTIEQRFIKPGFYDVHFYIGEDLISTYTVNVIK